MNIKLKCHLGIIILYTDPVFCLIKMNHKSFVELLLGLGGCNATQPNQTLALTVF